MKQLTLNHMRLSDEETKMDTGHFCIILRMFSEQRDRNDGRNWRV